MTVNARKSANYQMGGGKSPLRKYYYDYKDEIIFGLVLSVVVIVSNMLTPLIPVGIYHSIVMPTLSTMIATFCGGSAWLFWRHNDGKRMRKIMAGIMLAWTLITVGGLIARYRSDAPEIADGIFSIQGWEFVLGDILAWMLMVYPAEFRWADIGNWESLYDYLAYHDDQGNALNRTARRLLKDSSDNIVYSTRDDKLLAVRGLKDFIVVDTEDVLMICPRDEEKLKDFLSQLAMPEYEEYR